MDTQDLPRGRPVPASYGLHGQYAPMQMMQAYHPAPMVMRYGGPGPIVQGGGVAGMPTGDLAFQHVESGMDMFSARVGMPMMAAGQPAGPGTMLQAPPGTMMLAHPSGHGEPLHYYISQPMGVMPAFALQPMAGHELKMAQPPTPHGGLRTMPPQQPTALLPSNPHPSAPVPASPSHGTIQHMPPRPPALGRVPGGPQAAPAVGQPKRQVPRGLEENVKRTIYVSYVDVSVTEEELATFFSTCGQVMDCRICGDPNSAMRFAFLEFADVAAAQLALQQSGSVLGGWPLKVQPSKTAIVPVSKDLMPRSQDEVIRCSKTVYVASIDKHVERADVRAFFEQLCGPVARLRLLGDSSHQTRIAFVEFVDAEGAKAALNCSGALLGSMPVRVSPSKTPIRADVRGHKNSRERRERQQAARAAAASAGNAAAPAVPSTEGDTSEGVDISAPSSQEVVEADRLSAGGADITPQRDGSDAPDAVLAVVAVDDDVAAPLLATAREGPDDEETQAAVDEEEEEEEEVALDLEQLTLQQEAA